MYYRYCDRIVQTYCAQHSDAQRAVCSCQAFQGRICSGGGGTRGQAGQMAPELYKEHLTQLAETGAPLPGCPPGIVVPRGPDPDAAPINLPIPLPDSPTIAKISLFSNVNETSSTAL